MPSSKTQFRKGKSGNPGRQFQKGQSGNPGGLPKAIRAKIEAVREAATERCPRAIERLGELMEDPDGRVAVAACNAILDRGCGKPKQELEAKMWMDASGKELAEALPGALAAYGIEGSAAKMLSDALGKALEGAE